MASHGIQFEVHPALFLRDPQSSDYGKRVLSNSVLMFDELGFESFTFKKLAAEISSTEASVYRYFENKHKLLLYLQCWYWEWVNYLITINLINLEDPQKKLKVAIHNIVNAANESPLTPYINERVLHKVIIQEGSKAYHVHDIDEENKQGLFKSYKEVVGKVSNLIKEFNADFPYPNLLASNLFEMANNQIYFAEHLPRLTDIKKGKNEFQDLEEALCHICFKLLT